MFLKLCKHELKCSFRSFLTMYAIVFVVTVFLGITKGENMLGGISAFAYTGAIIATFIMVMVVIVRNYHLSMFSKAAYLTHTLPVSTTKLYLAKVVGVLFWHIVSTIVVILSIFLLISLTSRDLLEVTFNFTRLALLTSNLSHVLLGILYYISSGLSFISLCYLVMNVVHTSFVSARFRVLIGIVLFFVISWIASWLYSFIISYGASFGMEYDLVSSRLVFIGNVWIEIAWNILLMIVYSLISCWLLSKKMEVE